MIEQISIFGNTVDDKASECCYQCEHFAEFKEPRAFTDLDGEFIVFGMCCEGVGKNGSYYFYPIYVPGGKCKNFKKARKREKRSRQ